MDNDPNISKRKKEHVKAALEGEKHESGSPFDPYMVVHNALPEIPLSGIETSADFLEKRISAPFIIGSLTGGPDMAAEINRNLAAAAQENGIPLCLGSAKIAIKNPAALESFDVRGLCPDVPLLVNLGLVDLEKSFGLDDCRHLVEKLRADALIFHLNPLHEALQPEGNTDFSGLGKKLRRAVKELPFPVMVKEVGHGISPEVYKRLDACGVYAVDVAGRGGTSWGFIEGERTDDPARKKACETFSGWGLPAPWVLERMKGVERRSKLVASGGVRSGADVFKSLCLGADYASAALPFLRPALESAAAVSSILGRFILELRLAMFSAGCLRVRDARRELLAGPAFPENH